MLLFHERLEEGFMLTPSIPMQLISCTIACIGFAMWFKVRGRKVFYSGVGAFITWGIYALIYEIEPSNFLATLIAAVFVGFYAFIMSRVNKAPSTIFLTASVFPFDSQDRTYNYMMYGFVSNDSALISSEGVLLATTCLAIAFGFNIVDVVSRVIMSTLKREFRVTKNS